jgi:deubiquitinase DESI2
MGGALSVVAAAGDTEGASYSVVLNVYDLTPINNYLHWCGLGIFH